MMGCGSSTPPSVIEGENSSNGKAEGLRPRPKASTGARTDKDLDCDDLPTEVLPESQPAPIKPPLAFEIPLDSDFIGEEVEGLVKRHPPRPPPRLQRLLPPEQPPTLQDLHEKMESAEKRRQMILKSRIASANKASRQASKMMESDTNYDNDEQYDIIEDDSQQMKNVTALKNSINAENHGVERPIP